MIGLITRPQFMRVAIVTCFAVATLIAVFHSRSAKRADGLASLERGQADALVLELARCRTITSAETVALQDCRHAWADNREHFFAPAGSRPGQVESLAGVDTFLAKDRQRLLRVDAASERH